MKKLYSIFVLATAPSLPGEEINFQTTGSKLINLFNSSKYLVLAIGLVFGAWQTIKFIASSGQEKMMHLKVLGFTIAGVAVYMLLPSIINFIIGII